MKWNETSTIAEVYGPAMQITDQAEAEAYLEALIAHNVTTWGQTREEAEKIHKQSLGYYAGYYDRKTMDRVNRLFKTEHPVFGKTSPTPEQAMLAGVVMAATGARP